MLNDHHHHHHDDGQQNSLPSKQQQQQALTTIPLLTSQSSSSPPPSLINNEQVVIEKELFWRSILGSNYKSSMESSFADINLHHDENDLNIEMNSYNDFDEYNIKEIKDWWIKYRDSISKSEKENSLIQLVTLISDSFDSNSDIHYVLPFYNMDISQLVTDLSLELIRHFCDLFKEEYSVTPNNIIKFINRHITNDDTNFVNSILGRMDFEKIRNFYFKSTSEYPFYSYHDSLCNLITKSLSLLLESCNNINIMNGLSTVIITSMRLSSIWFGLPKNKTMNNGGGQQLTIENTNYTILSPIQERLAEYIQVYYTYSTSSEQYKIREVLTTEDTNPCIILSNLLLQISKKSVNVFVEVFQWTSLWKIVIDIFKNLSKFDEERMNIEHFIQFCNFTSLSFGNMFLHASKDIRKLIELSSSKVFMEMMQYLEQFVNSAENESKKFKTLEKVAILYVIEIYVWGLFTSLHLIPNLLIEFQHCDGYDLLKKVFYAINNSEKSESSQDCFLLQFQQQKMLTILHVMINLVLELTTHIQLVNQEEAIQEQLGKCKRNQHVFGLLVYLYNHTDMSKIGSDFLCKRELLDHLLSNLTLFHEEYFKILYNSEPFKYICENFTSTSKEMQIQVLKTFDHYIQLFTLLDSSNETQVDENLICRDFNEYLKLLLTNHDMFLDSIMRVCNHLISKIQDKSIYHKIQLLFRNSGFTKLILQSIDIKQRNNQVMAKLVQLIYLFLEGNLDNHKDFMGQLTPKSNPLYKLLYDEELIGETLPVIKMIVVNDKSQTWDFIISDLLEIMFINNLDESSFNSMYSNIHQSHNSSVKFCEKHLRMCEKILCCIRKMFLENENVKNSFRKCKGYEKIINLLVLNSTNLECYDLVFSIVQSCINLLILSMNENSDNEIYFKKFITFSSLLSPLHKCGFVKSYEHGINLTMNLLQFSVMDYGLYEPNNSDRFRKLIEEKVLLFENPEMIPEVILKLYGRNLSEIDPKLSNFLVDMLFRLVKYSTNRHRLSRAKSLLILMKEFTTVLLEPSHYLSNRITKLLMLLGAHNFSPREMQYYFTLFTPDRLNTIIQSSNNNGNSLTSTTNSNSFISILNSSGNSGSNSNSNSTEMIASSPLPILPSTKTINNLLKTLLELGEQTFIPNYYIDFSPLNKDKVFRYDDLTQLKSKRLRLFSSSSSKMAHDREERILLKRTLNTFSSILFPKMNYSSWPSEKGHTTTLWFRIESNSNSKISLFSFSSHVNSMVFNVSMTPDMKLNIEMERTNEKLEWTETFSNYEFKLYQWYFIGINQQLIQLQDKIEHKFGLFVNGFHVQEVVHQESIDKSIMDMFKSFLSFSQTSLEFIVMGSNAYDMSKTVNQTMKSVNKRSGSLKSTLSINTSNIASNSSTSVGLHIPSPINNNNTTNNLLLNSARSSSSSLSSNTAPVHGHNANVTAQSPSDEDNSALANQQEKLFTCPAFQLGNMFFIEECLNDEEMYMMYHLGPNYMGNFDEDLSQYFCNEMINEESVVKFKNKIYYMKDCSNNVGLSQLTNRFVFAFSSVDASLITRIAQQSQSNSLDSVDIVFSNNKKKKMASSNTSSSSSSTSNSSSKVAATPSDSNASTPMSVGSPTPSPSTVTASSSSNSNNTASSDASSSSSSGSGSGSGSSSNSNVVYNVSDIRSYIPNRNYNNANALNYQKTTNFTSIKCYLSGKTTLVSKCTFKGNLYVIGGMKAILGLYAKMKDPSSKIYTLLLLSYLMKNNSLNTSEMLRLGGYDMLNYHFLSSKDSQFEITPSVLLALLVMCGLDIPNDVIVNSVNLKVRDICKRGVINNFMAFEKLLLDYRIWHTNAKVDTLKKMLKCLAELVSSSFRSKVNEHHRAILLTTANGVKRLLFAMSQSYVVGEKIDWPIKIINPTIKILKCIIPTPISMTYVYPIVQYIILTHHQDYAQWMNENNMNNNYMPQLTTTTTIGTSEDGSNNHLDSHYGNVEIIEPRKSVLNMFYNLIEEAPEDVLEDFHSVLPTGQIIALLNTKSNLIRCILLKMLGVYLSRKETLKDQFIKSNAAHLLTLQLLEVGNPSLLEFQVMFDLMLGLFNNNTTTAAAADYSNDYIASPVKTRRNSIILSSGATSGGIDSIDDLLELGEGDDDKTALQRTSLFLPTSISHAAFLLPKSTSGSCSSNGRDSSDSSPTKKRSRSVYFKSMNAATIASSPTNTNTALNSTATSSSSSSTTSGKSLHIPSSSDSPMGFTNYNTTPKGSSSSRYITTNRLKNSISLIKYEFSQFEFREFLTPILRLIPCIKDIEEKINVFETICRLFKNGGEKLKLYFYEIKAHWYIQVYLSNLPKDNPHTKKFIKLTLDFIIDYVNYSILNIPKQYLGQYGLKGSVEILTNILQYLLVMEKSSYDIIFIQNMQRYILQGVLAFFQKNYLFHEKSKTLKKDKQLQKKEKKIKGHLSAVFISFCTCATDYIIQWFDLPPEPPVTNEETTTGKISMMGSSAIAQKYGNISGTRRNITRMFDDSSNNSLNTTTGSHTLKTSTSMIFEKQHIEDESPTVQSESNNTEDNPQLSQFKNVQFIDNYVGTDDTTQTKTVKIQQDQAWDQRSLSSKIFHNYERTLSQDASSSSEEEEGNDSTLFSHNIHDISGFIYWFIDSIRKCLVIQKKGSSKSSRTGSFYDENQDFTPITTPEFILVEQLKRIFMFLLDSKRSKPDHIFTLLQLLYFFPFHSELIIHDLLQEPPGYQEMVNCGKLLKSFCSDTKYITRLLFRTANLFDKTDTILPQLNRKVWKVIISTCKDYLKKNIFPKTFDPNDPDFVSMVEEASTVSENISSLIFEPSVIDQVREWESNEFSTFNSKLTAVTEVILKSEESDKKKDSNIRKNLRNEQTQLELNKIKYMKPHMLKLKSIKDTDLQARKQWKMLVKFIQEDVSSFNVYFHTTNSYCDKTIKTRSTITTTRSHVTKENDYHRLSFSPYDDETFENVDYKLDSTSGPNRVRMRMKRQLKKRPFNIDEFQSETQLTNVQSSQKKRSVKFSEITTVHGGNGSNTNLNNSQDDDEVTSSSTTTTTTLNENSYHLSISTIILEPKKCKRITPLRITEGDLILGEDGVYFIASCSYPLTIRTNSSSTNHSKQLEMKKTYNFSYEEIREIHNRRYLLKNNALEFFLLNGKSFFFAFDDGETRDRVLSILSSPSSRFNYLSLTPNLNLLNLVNYEEEVNGKLIFKKSITQKWVEGTISNFEYLMHLNILAGRSFNDLTQYPVFPFILRDYDSKELDLSDPNTFRDLKKPMGALNEKRLEKIIQQYENLKDVEDQIPYHYGSHYSTPIAVSYYLVRMEPFTRIFFEFNDGKLDLPDRTFHSLKKSWELSSGETQSKSDFKELTPEFFYLPEFLQNRNRIDFGILQNDKSFDDVELPPWANGDPVLFIRKHRKALESDYVSRNLHHWIDLIFGYKQRGESAINSYNVFHYMTYEGSLTDEVDLIDDPITREARWTQICTYGQTPKQLFKKAHPERYATTNLMGGEEDTINVIPITNYIFKVANELSPGNIRIFKEPVADIYIRNDQTTHNNSVIAVGKYKIFIPPSGQERRNSPVYLSYRHWDKTLRIEKWDNGKQLHIFHFMNQPEIYKCAKFSREGDMLVVGTNIGALHVFRVNNRIKIHNKNTPDTTNVNTDKDNKFLDHVATLSGHSDSVLCVAISTEFSMIISGSRDSYLDLLNQLSMMVKSRALPLHQQQVILPHSVKTM
ncbi:predicted protein [Naegleria gruberi]|uniref:Predicted protein n=1 Tax=Naegleria gruberi TaxID=5762 RepID=D2W3Y2_NAEGR|nr:uncharacterized protein NAEGRDRAFT_82279 [Naegleria gruberi]EFC36198.1 predicted protein [Naegleria gruberi]|eukprot:XP_002668942.1 predicted protein [Naegleria gruberi strain NEG-M]